MAGALSSRLLRCDIIEVTELRNLEAAVPCFAFDSPMIGLKIMLDASIERFDRSLNELIFDGLLFGLSTRSFSPPLVLRWGDWSSKAQKRIC